MPEGAISDRFGSPRGLARLGLSYVQRVAQRDLISRYDRGAIRRLLFVCHGNICRSAYADILARHLGARAASFGLSTSSGQPMHPPVAALAERAGLAASQHRTSTADDIVPQSGDLLLAMEFRHLARLRAHPAWGDTPRTLLGLFHQPTLPHLHDPYQLNPAFMAASTGRIAQATGHALEAHPGVISA